MPWPLYWSRNGDLDIRRHGQSPWGTSPSIRIHPGKHGVMKPILDQSSLINRRVASFLDEDDGYLKRQ